MENINLFHGDCLKVMPNITDKSVDLILCDLPYGTTKCKWDVVIPFDKLWEQYNRIIKDNGVILLFSKQPFTTQTISSNINNFKYCLIWKKDNHDNPTQAKRRFLNITEDICVFYKKQCTYNPQGLQPLNKVVKQGRGGSLSQLNHRDGTYFQEYTNYPRNILEFKRDLPNVHPTQKPVALLEYLIKTYTNEGEVVLDNCMGSGSTGVACVNLNRKFIGIEKEESFFNIANSRINHSVHLKTIA